MKVDLVFRGAPAAVAEQAQRSEELGLDAFRVPETRHDAFVALTLAAAATSRIELGSSVAIAFARNPMTLATLAFDLQRLSAGRFELGLGSQIRPHITNRFGMPWSQPARRMRELILAVRAIWDCWQSGRALDFRGDFYTHTLMTPAFDPGPLPVPVPRITLAAVGRRMIDVAVEVADGLICHPMTSEHYLSNVILPAAGRARRDRFEVSGQVLVATGDNDTEIEHGIAETRRQIAFYASTPAYRPVLECHGLGPLQDELNVLSKQGRWDEMSALVDDRTFSLFAVAGAPEDAGREVGRRYRTLLDRVSITLPSGAGPDASVRVLHAAAGRDDLVP